MVQGWREVIRVGFVLNFAGQGWLGGVSYFRNLFGALRDLPQRRVEPVIITRPDTPQESLTPFQPAQVLYTNLVNVEQPWWKARRIMQRYLGRDYLLENFLRKNKISILSHSGHLGRRCPLPALPWIPDFQERHLPEFFSVAELLARDRQIDETCRHAAAILLSSHAALHDLEKIRAGCAKRTHILQFVAAVPAISELPTRIQLEKKYGFCGPYFHLPNQFWIHKNHQLVVEALEKLKAQGGKATVLATGNTDDHRQPGHFESLVERVNRSELQDRFRILGVVPYLDLMGLMAHSVAVINPSLSEGWSTTVEEAKSFGKRVILSDIAVHREQAPERADYVCVNDPSALASQMGRALLEDDPIAEVSLMTDMLTRLPLRRQRFAQRFEEIVISLQEQYRPGLL